MPTWILLPLAIAGVLAIFLTTPLGHRLVAALGIQSKRLGGVPPEDHAYLLRVCGGDAGEVERRLESERVRNESLSRPEQYRRAIRTHMNERTRDGKR